MSWLEDSGLDPYDPYPDGPPEEDEDNAPQPSKLDEIFDYANPNTPTKFWRKERAKQKVKALMLEIIGPDDEVYVLEDYRQVLRKKVEAL